MLIGTLLGHKLSASVTQRYIQLPAVPADGIAALAAEIPGLDRDSAAASETA